VVQPKKLVARTNRRLPRRVNGTCDEISDAFVAHVIKEDITPFIIRARKLSPEPSGLWKAPYVKVCLGAGIKGNATGVSVTVFSKPRVGLADTLYQLSLWDLA
jgi:hypothetical protein